MRLIEFQRGFVAAILDPELRTSDGALGIRTHAGTPPHHKLQIHHSHFWNRMERFIRNNNRHLARYLGKAELDVLIRAYVVAHPPGGLDAADVPAALPGFLECTPPWSDSPVLPHLAHYNRRWAIAHAAAEEVALTLEELDPADHVRLIKRATVATTWYRFHALDLRRLPRTTPPDATPSYVLIHNQGAYELQRGEYVALEQLSRGTTVATVTETLEHHGYDAWSVFGRWTASQLLVSDELGGSR